MTFKKKANAYLKLGKSFYRLPSLEEIDFDGTLAEFDSSSLQSSTLLKKLDLGNACKVLDNALSGLASLEEVYVPVQQNVKTLGLQSLEHLKKVVININDENALSSLDVGLLNDVKADEILFESSGNALSSVNSGALSGLAVKAIDFHLSKMHEVTSGAFRDDVSLAKVTYGPLQLTSVQENAFEGCNEVILADAYGSSYLKEMHPHGAKQLTLQRMYSNTCLQRVYASAFMNVKLEHPVLNAPMLVNAEEYAFANV